MADLAASRVRYDRTRLRAFLVTALAYSALFHLVVHAQRDAGAGPADDASPDRGRTVFVQNCGFCHGTDARGGAEGGTDITVSPIVTADQSGSTLGPFLRVGRPERKMPPFALPPEQVSDISAYLRSLVAPSGRGRGRGGPTPVARGSVPSVAVRNGDLPLADQSFAGSNFRLDSNPPANRYPAPVRI